MMKRHILIVLLILCAYVSANANIVRVTLKNGTVFTCELKEFVPTDHVTVFVAGIESIIPISEVVSVEQLNNDSGLFSSSKVKNDVKLEYGKYAITDIKMYPDSFKIQILNQELTMILVRGGWFNMGYDGRNSLFWDSEPVHRVSVSSYYVSKQLLNCNTAETLIKKKSISNSTKPYQFWARSDAEYAIGEIRRITEVPFRLPTEAEWEYFSLMPSAKVTFDIKNNQDEWCLDHWYRYGDEQIGTVYSKDFVYRHFSFGNEKWKRGKGGNSHSAYVRIAISAENIDFNKVIL